MEKKISHEQFFEVLDKAEREIDRECWSVSGVDIWPVIKIYYSYHVLTHLMDERSSQIHRFQGRLNKGIRALSILWKTVLACLFDKPNNAAIGKTDVLIFVQSSTRFFKNEGCWYSPYSDTLQAGLDSCNIDSLVYETTEDGKFLFPRFGRTVLVQWALLVNAVIAKFKSIFLPNMLEKNANWPRFMDMVERELGAKYLPNVGKINFHVYNLLQQLPYFRNLVKNSGCSVCLMSGYYSSTMFSLIKACRAEGVKTIEIQHGVQGDAHLAYRSWSGLPVDDSNIMPDIFWTWSAREKATIDRWAQYTAGRHGAFVGGNPCLTIYNRRRENIVASANFSGYNFPSGEVSKVVLFTCQAFDRLPEFVIQAIRMRPDFGWVLRIHPQYWKNEQALRAQGEDEQLSNIIVDRGDYLPLGSAMQYATVHVTEFSSSVIEAAAIGLQSIVIHPYGQELYSDLITSGIACYIDNSEDMLQKITNISSSNNDSFVRDNEVALAQAITIIANLIGQPKLVPQYQ